MKVTVEVIDGSMVMLDEDGNGCGCHKLTSLRLAKRQVRRWQREYTFDYAEALRQVSEFFEQRADGTSDTK